MSLLLLPRPLCVCVCVCVSVYFAFFYHTPDIVVSSFFVAQISCFEGCTVVACVLFSQQRLGWSRVAIRPPISRITVSSASRHAGYCMYLCIFLNISCFPCFEIEFTFSLFIGFVVRSTSLPEACAGVAV